MRLSKKLLESVKVTSERYSALHLIDIKTGAIETEVETGKRIIFAIDGYRIYLEAVATHTGKTEVRTYTDFRTLKDFNVMKIAALFTRFEQEKSEYSTIFDGVNTRELREEQDRRALLHRKVLKEEEKYMSKLLNDEIKRIAKENVDAKRPPVTDLIPKGTVTMIEGE
jgi:hypothetical protein